MIVTLRNQVSLHAALVHLSSQWDGLTPLLVEPRAMEQRYLPSTVDDEMAAIIDAAGFVGWYRCPNGHPYSVGNCTFPMETARCSVEGCGALIGGSHHIAVDGVTRCVHFP